MEFEERVEKSKVLEKLFIGYCKEKNITWAHTGIEKLKRDYPEIRNKLTKLATESALNMRFFPDMMAIGIVGKDAWEIDLKYGSFIEKQAYECYMRLSLSGMKIGIVNFKASELKLIFISINDLKFKPVSEFYCVRGILMPNDGKWIYPKNLLPDKLQEWKKGGAGAGTTHGIIDYYNTGHTILIKNTSDFQKEK